MKKGRGHKKAGDDELCESYSRLGSVWAVGNEFGMCGQTVHQRLCRIGVINKKNIFNQDSREVLVNEYASYRDAGNLDALAKKLGRTKQFICRQAKKLGLTDQKKPTREYAIKPGSNPYARYHHRVRQLRGSPHKCEVCGIDSTRKQYDWANLTGKYEDPGDYKRMCKNCHRAYDKNRVMRAHLSHNTDDDQVG